jgi:hypothetical protein
MAFSPAKLRRERAEREYEALMGAEALQRQTVIAERRRALRDPDGCECGWKGNRAIHYGPHHSDKCPRFKAEAE